MNLYRRLTSLLVAITYLLHASPAFAGSPASVKVNLPIDEIEGLIQQLEDAGNQVVGQAGIQIRESIRELSAEMRQRIDQLQQAANEVISTAVAQLRALLDDLVLQAKALLGEVRNMITGAIECISEQLANRIAQLKSSILAILAQLAQTLKDAVDHIYVRAGQLVDQGSSRVAVVVNSTLAIVARIVLVVFIFLLLFWMLRAVWTGKMPKQQVFRIGVPVVVAILVGGMSVLLFSGRALASVLGSKVELPKWESACADGNRQYDIFMQLRNTGVTGTALQQPGDAALQTLNWCLYASMSPEVNRGTQQKIENVAAVLYPPPPPPPTSDGGIIATCGNTGGPSINPGWVSHVDLQKALTIQRLYEIRVLKPTSAHPPPPPPTEYFKALETRARIQPEAILRANPAPIHR